MGFGYDVTLMFMVYSADPTPEPNGSYLLAMCLVRQQLQSTTYINENTYVHLHACTDVHT